MPKRLLRHGGKAKVEGTPQQFPTARDPAINPRLTVTSDGQKHGVADCGSNQLEGNAPGE